MTPDAKTEAIELRLLCEAIAERYGYDFRRYVESSLGRRVRALMQKTGVGSISQLQHKVLHDPEEFNNFLCNLTVRTSEMFRDPAFFRAFREEVVPVLRTYPSLRFWVAGCSTGEEAYSLAILLREEGLARRSVIFATDINPAALAAARAGRYAPATLRLAAANHALTGAPAKVSDWLDPTGVAPEVDPRLRETIVFSEHNLERDGVFAEVNVVFCRNVLIYFEPELQGRVVDLFLRSLTYKGYLCLGSKETVMLLPESRQFEVVDEPMRIFRKIKRQNG